MINILANADLQNQRGHYNWQNNLSQPDDSGIEDTWNEENLSNMPSATNLRAPVSITGEEATVPLAEEVSVNNLNPLVPQDDKSRQIPYGPANISTSAPTLSTQSIIRCDVKGLYCTLIANSIH